MTNAFWKGDSLTEHQIDFGIYYDFVVVGTESPRAPCFFFFDRSI